MEDCRDVCHVQPQILKLMGGITALVCSIDTLLNWPPIGQLRWLIAELCWPGQPGHTLRGALKANIHNS